MSRHLAITIRLYDDRYHGVPEWPPSPARVFQALVAGVVRANRLPDDMAAALAWLQTLPAPIIAAPPARRGQRVATFVPNNDADTLGGDLGRVAEIRTKKVLEPWLLETGGLFLYAWPISDAIEMPRTIERIAEAVYQLGRGIDMAYAYAEVVGNGDLEERLARHRGSVHRPGHGEGSRALECPTAGSLESLLRRYDEAARRLRTNPAGRDGAQLFVQPSKPRFEPVPYDRATVRWVFALRPAGDETAMHPWRLSRAVALVERIRDTAAAKLRAALPVAAADVERVLVGRKADGSDTAPLAWRIRIVPLPSIGHQHADQAIRRVMIEMPSGGPLAVADVRWAFSGLTPTDPEAGTPDPFVLTPADDDTMIEHYTQRSRHWRTVTPAALPETAKRRRIDPVRQRAEAKDANERSREEAQGEDAVRTALRHAGVSARPVRIRVQREPFAAKGTRAEAFADRSRFAKERLWHVEIELERSISGPLALGDGRFLGLGVLEPQRRLDGVVAFVIADGLSADADPVTLARALRRAVMARAQADFGRHPLPPFFSGHAEDGGAAAGMGSHLAFHFDPPDRLLIVSPHLVERRRATDEELRNMNRLERCVHYLTTLRAGAAGLLAVRRSIVDTTADPIFATSAVWQSRTPYTVNRHAKATTTAEALIVDVEVECRRRQLPKPTVIVDRPRGISGHGLTGDLVLRFPIAIPGPLALGRSRHLGGGLFAAAQPSRDRPDC